MRALLVLLILFSGSGYSQSDDDLMSEASKASEDDSLIEQAGAMPAYMTTKTEYSLVSRPKKKRNVWWPQLFSIPLPGLDQWMEGQYSSAAIYSLAAAFAMVWASENVPNAKGKGESDEEFLNRSNHGFKERSHQLALQYYQTIGGFSAYHSFRTAVRTRRPYGEYTFLSKEETTKDLLLAPFRFDFMLRPTTYVPMLIGGALYFIVSQSVPSADKDVDSDPLDDADMLFASAFSYNAGTHEEAVFRGWVQPNFRQMTGSDVWANLISNTIFAALHISPQNPVPWPQFALGYHLGYVTQIRQWTLAESIFIHVWWDVLAFMAQYQIKINEDNDSRIPMPALHLPPFAIEF